MIQMRMISKLLVQEPSQPERPPFVCSGSGLLVVGDTFYVVADDEFHLGVFKFGSDEAGRVERILPGVLPLEHGARKRAKQDLEALALIPPQNEGGPGALLAVPSGSTSRRETGALIELGPGGEPGQARTIDFGPLYARLRERLSELNIEGCALSGGSLVLLQRGNGPRGENAVIELDWGLAKEGIRMGSLPASTLQSVHGCDLGLLRGVKLSFTDAAPLADGRILFSAAAEDSPDTYQDGLCVGSAIGIIGRGGKVVALEELSPDRKVEGVSASERQGALSLLLVTDADDPATPAELFEADWEPGR